MTCSRPVAVPALTAGCSSIPPDLRAGTPTGCSRRTTSMRCSLSGPAVPPALRGPPARRVPPARRAPPAHRAPPVRQGRRAPRGRRVRAQRGRQVSAPRRARRARRRPPARSRTPTAATRGTRQRGPRRGDREHPGAEQDRRHRTIRHHRLVLRFKHLKPGRYRITVLLLNAHARPMTIGSTSLVIS